MLSRDHYAVLGVAPDADAAAIEASFRHLCRRYHPDLNPGDSAAVAAFERIKLAYDVLADSEERARYDREGRPAADAVDFPSRAAALSAPGRPGNDSYDELFRALRDHARRSRPERGSDIHVTATIRLADVERGRRAAVEVRRLAPCAGCGGRGRVAMRRATPCNTCHGSGREIFGRGALSVALPCADCGGEGLHAGAPCEACNGAGLGGTPQTLVAQIPPGVSDGQHVRLPGLGHHGPRGGPPGDLVVTCRVQADPRFERQGPHLVTTLPLSVSEAVLGARVQIETLSGESVPLRVPPGTTGGAELRLRNRGLEMTDGRRGDLIAVVEIWIPDFVDEDAKRLISAFGERTPAPRRNSGRRATVRR